MADITVVLHQLQAGDPFAAAQLLPLIYDELRRLARQKMAAERPDHTLQATALVHEAYVRLVGASNRDQWNSRGHFFAAAAEAMRRILVEEARRKQAQRHGGDVVRQEGLAADLVAPAAGENILALNDALDKLERVDAEACSIVKLRFFAGLTVKEAAAVAGVSSRQADFLWAYARAWLRRELST